MLQDKFKRHESRCKLSTSRCAWRTTQRYSLTQYCGKWVKLQAKTSVALRTQSLPILPIPWVTSYRSQYHSIEMFGSLTFRLVLQGLKLFCTGKVTIQSFARKDEGSVLANHRNFAISPAVLVQFTRALLAAPIN